MINKDKIEKAKQFITHDIWQIDTAIVPLKKRLGFVSIRVLTILFKGFKKDNCIMQAAALTNITIMSMVPTLAFMFAIAKGLQFDKKLQEIIDKAIVEYPQAQEYSVQLFEMIEKTNFKALGSIGVILLLWTVISVMSKIESSFNTIWGISKPRDFLTKCKEYLITVMIVPFALLATASINTALRSGDVAKKIITQLGSWAFIYDAFLWVVSPCLVALAFTYLYKFLPNTKVKIIPAFIAALITTFLWQLSQWIFLKFQVEANSYSNIYGTFAAIPLFLGWLNTSWIIVLFGAELSFAIQNESTYENEGRSSEIPTRTLLVIALYTMQSLSKNFIDGKEWQADEFFKSNNIPTRLGNKVLDLLTSGNVVSCTDPLSSTYLPAQDLQNMNLWSIYEAVIGKEDKIIENLKDESLKDLIKFNETQLKSYATEMSNHKIYELVNHEV
ncbi:MAG: YihY/virulence factor BrkB family protein [Lentisphaeraceae bacterium]|nr:YihY/virulence factor BrkB family protein [Lentisphaeraceae bacterium]